MKQHDPQETAVLRSALALATALRIVLPALAISFFLPAFARAQVPENPEKPLCVIDRVDGVLAEGGRAALIGWAADPKDGSVAKMEIVSGAGATSEVARWGEWRPDVMAHFARPDYLWSGWTATVELSGVRPGTVPVEVYAVSRSGVRTSCGHRELVVRDVPEPRLRPAWLVGLGILWRTAALIGWLTLTGWAIARLFCLRPLLLSAPLVGLALFGIFTEAGAALHVRPVQTAAVMSVLAILALVFLRRRQPRPPLSWRSSIGAIGALVLYAVIGIAPLASHGDGAVLGDIDDGVRQCTVADSVSQFGWRIPSGMRGYLATMRDQWDVAHMRRGDVHLLAALASAFGERAHAVHSVAMLAGGCLVVLGTGLLAFRLIRSTPKTRWIPPLLLALNSTLIATLYNQHLGNLLGAALFLLFLSSILVLLRSRRPGGFVPAALCLAAAFSFYPETLPVWGLSAGLSLLTVRALWRRRRALGRYVLALVLAAALNPVAVVRVVRSWVGLSDEPTLSAAYNRMVVGDTHYFPSLNVVTGLTAYRIDTNPPMGSVRSALAPIATALILVVSVLGWRYLSNRGRWLLVTLLAPPAFALWANYRIDFPYGFAKFLCLAAPVWSLCFGLLASKTLSRGGFARILAAGTIALVLLLEVPSARHVVRHAVRAATSYDPAFRSLPALAHIAGRGAVLEVGNYPLAGNHWILYFLGENAVDFDSKTDDFPGAPRFRVVDRRQTSETPAGVVAASRDFWLVSTAAPN